jgi:hypothetical protein
VTEPGERYAWYTAKFYEDLAEEAERLATEESDEVARASVYFALETNQLGHVLTPLRASALQAHRGPNWWADVSVVVDAAAEAVEASLLAPDFGFREQIERNRMIVERMQEIAARRSRGASSEMLARLEVFRKTLTRRPADAPQCRVPPPEGERPVWADRSKPLGHEPARSLRHFFLQGPRDRSFRQARAATDDESLRQLLDEWVDDLDASYRDLVEGTPAECFEHADLAFEATALEGDGHHLLGIMSPARMQVGQRLKGDLAGVEEVATRQLPVKGGISPQPDGIDAMAGERWRILGHRLGDGTVMPCRGSHRL